ncbi:hypothetical protein A2115_03755 [Candidatus Woesebacteria bacterium GWA1_41_8]|jgi:hypothetical protein|uniref:Uncharacterized protein n=1 Tax=Candidatus Woesebacteria bacterium GWA1_41_8 TaxID=1802471 RepID=A0A1F7WGI1_9BACT|nr:MAG: hypothetical protein A2115_03755 [Candidatus Woesebacteria bacterium GWA1_41_8]
MPKDDHSRELNARLHDVVTEDFTDLTREQLERWQITPGQVLESVGYSSPSRVTRGKLKRMLREVGLEVKGRTSGQYITTREREG